MDVYGTEEWSCAKFYYRQNYPRTQSVVTDWFRRLRFCDKMRTEASFVLVLLCLLIWGDQSKVEACALVLVRLGSEAC